MKKAVILLSGGLDSATCLAIAKNAGYICHALSFNYGQKHAVELAAAKKIAQNFNISHQIMELRCNNKSGISDIAKSALTTDNITVTNYANDDQIPNTYVPARNTMFIACALSYAESIMASSIFIGASSIDYSGYPDCRPEYFTKFQELINLATKAGVEGNTITLETPLAKLSKADTIKLGIKLGINYGDTISCYRANQHGAACGTCDSCHLRKQGFIDANITDPTVYT